jgi:shikimate kinase
VAPGSNAQTAVSASPNAHVILVGLPGSGKTTVGKRLASAIGRRFVDFDTAIEERVGRSVAEIFAGHGELRFRALELELTRELAHAEPMVLAPGGGWCTVPGAVELLRPPGVIVYLRVRPEVARDRLLAGAEHLSRPLLSGGDPLAKLRDLLSARDSMYCGSDAVIDAEHIVDTVVTSIQQALAALRTQD